MSDSDHTRRSWILAVLLAWAVPGLGHWYLGRPGKAAVFLVGIVGLYLVGWGLGQWRVVDYRDTWPFILQAMGGTLAVATNLVGDVVRARAGAANPVPVGYESGLVYTMVAGLLNLLVMLDAYIVANNIRRPTHPVPAEETE